MMSVIGEDLRKKHIRNMWFVGIVFGAVVLSSIWIMINAAEQRDRVDACVIKQGPVLGAKEFCRAQVRQAR